MKYYCYVGDIKKLIPAGFTFQKLYASNYKAYHKDNIFMFVVSKMILEISNVRSEHQTALIGFILKHKDKPESFWHSKRENSFFKDTLFANWVLQDGVIMTECDVIKIKVEWFKEFEKCETIDCLEDGFQIRYELVKDVLKLNEIGGVELIEVEK